MDIRLTCPALDFGFTNPPAFSYTRFRNESTDIRLLKVLAPSIATETNTIQLELFHTEIENAPEYVALSYTWGRPFETCPAEWDDKSYLLSIIVNGCGFAIRPNLWHALREIRRSIKSHPLWIDAICIDQMCIPEKNKQVQRMAEIYQTSAMALVWLGPADSFTNQAYEWMFHIAAVFKCQQAKLKHTPEKHKQAYAESVRLGFSDPSACTNWRAVQHVLTSTWFERVWVAQELCLAPCALVRCGHRLISWTDVNSVADTIIQHGTGLRYLPSFEDEARLLGEINIAITPLLSLVQLVWQHDKWADDGLVPPLYEVLDILQYSKAGNILDKVYAGLGLAKRGVGVNVDYTKSTTEVFIDALTYSHDSDTTLDPRVLGYCQYPSAHADLPSWVPDWSTCRPQNPVSFPKHALTVLGNPHQAALFSAGGTLESDKMPHIISSERLLTLYGGLWNEIAFVSSHLNTHIPQSATAARRNQDAIKRAIIADASWLREWAVDREARELGYSCIDTSSWSYQPIGDINQFQRLIYALTGEGLLDAYWTTLRADVYQDPQSRKEVRSDGIDVRTEHLGQYMDGRCFACTNGASICLVPEATRVGDLVAVANGIDVPFVLRENGEAYIFIGECYVHGIMDGEAYERCRKDCSLGKMEIV